MAIEASTPGNAHQQILGELGVLRAEASSTFLRTPEIAKHESGVSVKIHIHTVGNLAVTTVVDRIDGLPIGIEFYLFTNYECDVRTVFAKDINQKTGLRLIAGFAEHFACFNDRHSLLHGNLLSSLGESQCSYRFKRFFLTLATPAPYEQR
ncbi:hypothetical protein IKG24_01945 [Candidatus Saccharibacteria bacterium]|nr:hypothetical protein [Candidatus Saccharibacteria bacterium]